MKILRRRNEKEIVSKLMKVFKRLTKCCIPKHQFL
jgi:hypothetical protein